MLSPKVQIKKNSYILFDRSKYTQLPSEWFLESYWRDHNLIIDEILGRGKVFVVQQQDEKWVLRHYHRGGLIANVTEDIYVWTGLEKTRSFREWRLLQSLYQQNLPVPRPISAQVIRNGIFYSANIITECIENSHSWASLIISKEAESAHWRTIGLTLKRFHQKGVNHVDLNAHNIIIDSSEQIYLVDFDRSGVYEDGTWKKKNINRLLRSLKKLSLKSGCNFNEKGWKQLLSSYNSGL
tara:strand:- start:6451 stop:7167 length:717 start_codon:yes stop_codon:yes gene_type:complete